MTHSLGSFVFWENRRACLSAIALLVLRGGFGFLGASKAVLTLGAEQDAIGHLFTLHGSLASGSEIKPFFALSGFF